MTQDEIELQALKSRVNTPAMIERMSPDVVEDAITKSKALVLLDSNRSTEVARFCFKSPEKLKEAQEYLSDDKPKVPGFFTM